jgi:hypothetical protein
MFTDFYQITRFSLNIFTALSNNFFPLPWREGIKGRGITPTLTLPHQGGGNYKVTAQSLLRV